MPAHLGVAVGQPLTVGDAEHLPDQVDAADFFGDRVLDLQPGVDLEEGDGAVLPDQELAGPGADVAGRAQDVCRCGAQLLVLLGGQERRGCFLDQFLVPPLQRAVPGGHDYDVAVGVGQALRLDVPGPVQVSLHEALAAAEGGGGLANRRLELPGDLLAVPCDLQPAAAAAEGGLDGDWQAVLGGEGLHLLRSAYRAVGAGC